MIFFKQKQFIGNYKTWKDAKKNSIGYDDDKIIKRAIHCKNFVLQGGALYERNLRLFHDKPFDSITLASLLWIYAREKKLSVLDLGGSFGTSYHMHKDFLEGLNVKWNVVEQENYARYGKQSYETKTLKFFQSPKDCEDINVLYLSGVLAYLEKPFEIIKDIKPNYIILDNNHFSTGKTRLVVQKTNKMTMSTAFSCWIFNKEEFMNNFYEYEVIREWKGKVEENMYYGGALMKLK